MISQSCSLRWRICKENWRGIELLHYNFEGFGHNCLKDIWLGNLMGKKILLSIDFKKLHIFRPSNGITQLGKLKQHINLNL